MAPLSPSSSASLGGRGDPPTLDQQIAYQRDFRNSVAADANNWPDMELEYADAILESLERLRGLKPE